MRIGFVIFHKNRSYDAKDIKRWIKDSINSAYDIDIYRSINKSRIILSLDEKDFRPFRKNRINTTSLWGVTNLSKIHKFNTSSFF